jgi:hypothetical protein
MNDRETKEDVLVTRCDGLPSLFDTEVVRQTRSNAIPIDLLPDFLEVPKEHSRVFNITMRAISASSSSSSSIARHAPLAV